MWPSLPSSLPSPPAAGAVVTWVAWCSLRACSASPRSLSASRVLGCPTFPPRGIVVGVLELRTRGDLGRGAGAPS